jgi:iron complex transport system permease protein
MAFARETDMNARICILFSFSLLTVLAAPFIGYDIISPAEIIGGDDASVFWLLRVPRTVMAFLTGAALSLCGTIFQATFRNPLATPYTLGIASGASLGTAVFYILSVHFVGGSVLFSFLGAVLSAGIVLLAGSCGSSILLAGVALNFTFSAIVVFIQYISSFANSLRLIRFMLGGLETASVASLTITLPIVILFFIIVMTYRRELDIISQGDEFALSRGVNLNTVKLIFYIVTSLVLGVVVSIAGPIGFVGMMAPHIMRLLIGTSHMKLVPVAFAFGGAFLTRCDTFARIVIFPAEIPVGAITAMLGGPFFIFLLIKNKRSAVI